MNVRIEVVMVLFLVGSAQAEPPDYKKDCSDAGCHGSLTRVKNVHSPLDDGACDACHEARPGEDHKFQWTTEPEELCLECHDSVVEDMTFLHGPVAAGECTACHDPHAAKHKALLSATGTMLCTDCHESVAEALEERAFKHVPVTEDCLSCHNPHGGANRFNLTAAAPDLCLDCHDSVGEVVEDAAAQHDAVTTGRACLNCHEAHASDLAAMLVGKPMKLCLSCHEKEQASSSGTLRGLGQLLRDMPHHHGPVANGSCTDCHQPHGGANFRMLVGAYPASFYAPFAEERYGVCFECHDAEAFETEKTDELTNFRNGERNLHFLHVNRSKKGRTCRACHDPHASENPVHITKTARFGNWDLPLNFEQRANGGSCQPGCHRSYRYDRESPVSNLPTKPDPAASSN